MTYQARAPTRLRVFTSTSMRARHGKSATVSRPRLAGSEPTSRSSDASARRSFSTR